jgi:hypothetical protein
VWGQPLSQLLSVIIAGQTITKEEWLFLLKPIPAAAMSCQSYTPQVGQTIK